MDLSKLSPAKGAIHKEKRIGRGEGSGHGGTSTRGHKGAKSRSGYSRKSGFEGGQMPLYRRVPKFGFKNFRKIKYRVINIELIEKIVSNTGVTSIDQQVLIQNGIAEKKDLIKILSRGELNSQIEIKAHAFSKEAIRKIEQNGGSAIKI